MALQVAMARGQHRNRSKEIPEGLDEARAKVDAMLDEATRELAPSHLILGGFSQGAMLSCDTTLRSTRKIHALVQLSGTWIAEDEWLPRLPNRAGLKTLISHGDEDPILPFVMAEHLRDAMIKAEFDVRWIPFHGGHEIPPIVLAGVSDLLREVVAPSA